MGRGGVIFKGGKGDVGVKGVLDLESTRREGRG